MAKKIIALVLIFCLIFPVAALAKGKPADNVKGPKVEKSEKPDKPAKSEKPEKPGKVGKDKKPEKPAEKGRMHAIQVILAKWARMPESALKGLWNALLNIGKKTGFVPEKPSEEKEEPSEGGGEQPGT